MIRLGFIITLGLLLELHSIAQVASRLDVVIVEIMADPSPQVALPNTEFIELKNISSIPYDLMGWRFSNGSTTATITKSFVLHPDSLVLICSPNNYSVLASFGATIGIANFPALDNSGDLLFLLSREGSVIHAIEYNSSWYNNPIKKDGGWSLEMIDTQNPCTGGGNWSASTDPSGGTPGRKNAVDRKNVDLVAPSLLFAFAIDSLNLVLQLDEPLDSLSASIVGNYRVSDNIGVPVQANVVGPLFDRTFLRLKNPLLKNKVYSVEASDIRDCSGNPVGAINSVRAGLCTVADRMDIIINEVLFNPWPDGADYVELYNAGNKIINLKQLYLANRNPIGSINSTRNISQKDMAFFPGDYIVITENAGVVRQQYNCMNPLAIIEMSSMPSYPDEKGTIVLMNNQGLIVDELQYEEKWHFALLNNKEGVALERIDPNRPTQDHFNWHSAATGVGYGTPGFKNSQFRITNQLDEAITISPELFSPDNDGMDDFLIIQYRFPEPGYVCNLTLFDANGRPVRYLSRNTLCGSSGYFRWDGLDEKNARLNRGIYFVQTEVFNLKGKLKRFLHPITLARKLY